jgi:flavodoxin
MDLEVFIEHKKDGDMKGKFYVFIGEEDGSGYRVYVSSLEQAAEEVKQFVLDNYKE